MEYFLPSEIGRLVLGYLKEVGCPNSYKTFLHECVHLREYSVMLRQGCQYPTTIAGKNLKQMLNEYGRTKLLEVQVKSDPLDGLWLKHDVLMDQIKNQCTPACVQSTTGYGYRQRQIFRTRHGVAKNAQGGMVLPAPEVVQSSSQVEGTSAQVREPAAQVEGTAAQIPGTVAQVPEPTLETGNGDFNDEADMGGGDSDSGSCLVMETQSPGSSVPCTPVKVSLQTLSLSQLGGQAKDIFSNQDITTATVPGLRRRYKPTKSNSDLSDTDPESLSKSSASTRTSRVKPANCPSTQTVENRFTNHQRTKKVGSCVSTSSAIQQTPEGNTSGPVQVQNGYNTRQRVRQSRRGRGPDNGVASTSGDQKEARLQQSPIRDEAGIPVLMPQKPRSIGFKPDLYTPMKEGFEFSGLAGKSPRRKCPVPKRRSSGADLLPPPQLLPVPAPSVGSTSSNDSAHSELLNMPMLDDLIKNVQFVEKMAESINKAKLVAEPQRVRVEEYSNGVTKKVPSSLVQNLNTPELTQPCSSVEKQSSAVPSHSTVLDSNTDEVSNVLHIQDSAITEEAIKGIIEMTRSDSEFDALFHMFHVDKNKFMEQEYGIALPEDSDAQPETQGETQGTSMPDPSTAEDMCAPAVIKVISLPPGTKSSLPTAQVLHPATAEHAQYVETIQLVTALPKSSKGRSKKTKKDMKIKNQEGTTKPDTGKGEMKSPGMKSCLTKKVEYADSGASSGAANQKQLRGKSKAKGGSKKTKAGSEPAEGNGSGLTFEVVPQSHQGTDQAEMSTVDTAMLHALCTGTPLQVRGKKARGGFRRKLNVGLGIPSKRPKTSCQAVTRPNPQTSIATTPHMSQPAEQHGNIVGGHGNVGQQGQVEVLGHTVGQSLPVSIPVSNVHSGQLPDGTFTLVISQPDAEVQVSQAQLPYSYSSFPVINQLANYATSTTPNTGLVQIQHEQPALQHQQQDQRLLQLQHQQQSQTLSQQQLQHQQDQSLSQQHLQTQQQDQSLSQLQHQQQSQSLSQQLQHQQHGQTLSNLKQHEPPLLQVQQDESFSNLEHHEPPVLQSQESQSLSHLEHQQPVLQHQQHGQSLSQLQHQQHGHSFSQLQHQQHGHSLSQLQHQQHGQSLSQLQHQQHGLSLSQLEIQEPLSLENQHEHHKLPQLQQQHHHHHHQGQQLNEQEVSPGTGCDPGVMIASDQPAYRVPPPSSSTESVPLKASSQVLSTTHTVQILEFGESKVSVHKGTVAVPQTASPETLAVIYSNPQTPTLGATEVVPSESPLAVSPYSAMISGSVSAETPHRVRWVKEQGSARTRSTWSKCLSQKKQTFCSPLAKASTSSQLDGQKRHETRSVDKAVTSPDASPAKHSGNGTPLRVKEAEAAETMMALATTPVKETVLLSFSHLPAANSRVMQNLQTQRTPPTQPHGNGDANNNSNDSVPPLRTPGKNIVKKPVSVSPVRSTLLKELVRESGTSLQDGTHQQTRQQISVTKKLQNGEQCAPKAHPDSIKSTPPNTGSSSSSQRRSSQPLDTLELERAAIKTIGTLRQKAVIVNKSGHEAGRSKKRVLTDAEADKYKKKPKRPTKSKEVKGQTSNFKLDCMDIEKFLSKLHSEKP